MDENKGNDIKRKPRIENSHMRTGLMLFFVGLALIISYKFISNPSSLLSGIAELNDILMPFYIGLIMAYLLCPVFNACTRLLYKLFCGKLKHGSRELILARFISSLISIAIVIIAVTGMIILVVPDLIDNVLGLIPKIEPAFNRLTDWVQNKLAENPEIVELLSDRINEISDTLIKLAKDKIVPGAAAIISGISVGAIGTVGVLIDFLIALVICVYVLNSKEVFLAQTKKIIIAIFSEKRAESIFDLAHTTDRAFGGFINGKIIDSVIIGLLCFLVMTILGMPTTVLISVIVGVTNVIPFFGPFIGAIPSVLLLLMVDPVACLKFIIFIIILQQFDGNILGPKILGKTTKLSGFWVMFSIIFFGGLFGVPGMLIGVPTFAVIYTYIARGVNRRLKAKGRETRTIMYEDYSKYDSGKETIIANKLERRKKKNK